MSHDRRGNKMATNEEGEEEGRLNSPEYKQNEQQKGRIIIRGSKAPEIQLFERKNWLLHLHYIRKDFETCKVLIQELLNETSGQCEYAVYIKGLILRQEGNLHESLRFFQQAVQLNSSNPSNLKQVARSLFLLGSYKTALDTYSQAELLSQDWEVLHNKGLCYSHLKEYNEAIQSLTMAIQASPQVISFKELGSVHLSMGNIPKAIETYRKATKHNPEDSELLARLGLLYLQIGSSQKAFECLGSSLTFDPSNYKAILAAGSIIQSHSDNDVALSKYRIAAQSSPESPHLWNNIGMCFYGKSKFVAAISCLKRATYLAPFEWKILYNLGLVHIAMTQYASSFHFLRAAQRIESKNPQILMLLGISLAHLDDEDNSLRAYEQALEINNLDPIILLNYCITLYNIGKTKSATEHLIKFQTMLRSLANESIDPEVHDVNYRLGAVLQIGEVRKLKPLQTEEDNGEEEERIYSKVVRQEDGSKVTVKVKVKLPQEEK